MKAVSKPSPAKRSADGCVSVSGLVSQLKISLSPDLSVAISVAAAVAGWRRGNSADHRWRGPAISWRPGEAGGSLVSPLLCRRRGLASIWRRKLPLGAGISETNFSRDGPQPAALSSGVGQPVPSSAAALEAAGLQSVAESGILCIVSLAIVAIGGWRRASWLAASRMAWLSADWLAAIFWQSAAYPAMTLPAQLWRNQRKAISIGGGVIAAIGVSRRLAAAAGGGVTRRSGVVIQRGVLAI